MDRVAMTRLQECCPPPAAPDISQPSRNHWTSMCVRGSEGEADHQRPSGFILTPSSRSLEPATLKGSTFISLAMLLLPARQPQEILEIIGNISQVRVGCNQETTDLAPPSLSVGLSHSLTDSLNPVYSVFSGLILCP